MMELLFPIVALGTPAAICAVAVIGAYFNESDDIPLRGEEPARSTAAELHYRRREIEEMLETVNRYRRERGAAERTLRQLSPSRTLAVGISDVDHE